MHLHGEINQSRSSIDPNLVYDVEMKMGQQCELGSQLRPNIVWFGEAVPMIEQAIPLLQRADVVIVIGTSMQVYPAAGLLNFSKPTTQVYNIDPNSVMVSQQEKLTIIKQKAGLAVPVLVKKLL